MTARLDAATVRQAAQGRWPHILSALGIVVPDHPKKHGPCPTCGGRDRFRFDDRDEDGTWFCNQCTPKAGDGLALVGQCLGLSFPDTLKAVAGVLWLDLAHRSIPHQPLPPPPARLDRVATAFRFELAALDLRLRAAKIQEAATQLNITTLTDAELDRALELVARGYADIARADTFEQVADHLRVRDFLQRKDADERRTRAA